MALKDKFGGLVSNFQNGIKQLYDGDANAVSRINNFAESLIYNLNTKANDRYDFGDGDLMETMRRISVMEFWDFNTAMGMYMDRLMRINSYEKNITLDSIGQDAHFRGDSDSITRDALRPSYVGEDNNYIDFMQRTKANEIAGVTTTQKDNNDYSNNKSISPRNFDYGNLYPDELDSGTFVNKWYVSNERNSILYKTKRLFEQRKINTLISRFGTNADGSSNVLPHNGSSSTKYGESHGRNLLKSEAQYGGSGQYNVNGYNNPYCRVWTHHHQYSRLQDTMRPDWDSNKSISEFHMWPAFKGGDTNQSWKGGEFANQRWGHSVLDATKGGGDGIVKITPKHKGNGGKENIHTKDCMFSIENLAWKGFDPFKFETALSWEQRGPLGGRIMWFPPYGISFQETTNANWNGTTFIGRGEKVYTYIDTERTGSLSFLMVVDHPSILDYALQKRESSINDTDILRFFAGCDPMSGNHSLWNVASPTYLTDEYTQLEPPPQKQKEEKKETQVPTQSPPSTPEDPPLIEELEVEFNVYFPNNYSGYYDRGQKENGDADFVITYLLAGQGAQMQMEGQSRLSVVESEQGGEVMFNFQNIGKFKTMNGYEIKNALSNDEEAEKQKNKGNFIYNYFVWSKSKGITGYNQVYDIAKTTNRKWYYRIDGEYHKDTPSVIENTYGQGIGDATDVGDEGHVKRNRQDTQCFRFNVNPPLDTTKENAPKQSNGKHVYCSFAEFAYFCARIKGYEETAKTLKTFYTNTEKINMDEGDNAEPISATDYLEEIFLGKEVNGVWKKIYKLTGAKITGASNKHGRKDRNDFLAKQRAMTLSRWIEDVFGVNNNEIGFDPEVGPDLRGVDESDKKAKQYRYATVVLKFNREQIQASSAQTEPIFSSANELKPIENPTGANTRNSAPRRDGTSDNGNETDDTNNTTVVEQTPTEAKPVQNDIIKDMPKATKKFYQYVAERDNLKGVDDVRQEYGWTDGDVHNYLNRIGYDETKVQRLIDYESKYPSSKWEKMTSEEIYEEWLKEHEKDGSMTKSNLGLYTNSKTDKPHEDNLKDIFVIIQKTLPDVKEKFSAALGQGIRAIKEAGADAAKSERDDSTTAPAATKQPISREEEANTLRYDQEYHFFEELKASDKIVYEKLMDKLRFFDPAFHSMTPEGFNARLTFLHQCTRQGNTIAATDAFGRNATNLAFGRPPFCVLRLGDFYNQMIVIDNINIDYSVSDGIQWDMNMEGIGMQPLLAQVNISFKFIGGGDLTGPIRRLQNAMTFNYYANTGLYDNRSDYANYNYDYKTMKGELVPNESYAFVASKITNNN